MKPVPTPSDPTATSSPAHVDLTRQPREPASQPAQRRPARQDAQLPHERDQHPDSQAAPEAPNQEVGEQAHLDVKHGLVDTDDALRAESVERGRTAPPQPTGPVQAPRQAVRREAGKG